MTERELLVAWAAGFFDGEGCVSIIASPARLRRWNPCIVLRINAGQRLLPPLLRLQMLFGGTIHRHAGKHGAFRWQTSNKFALAALLEMEPFLIVKRPHVRIAQELMTLKKIRSRGDADLEQRMVIKEAMSVLNTGHRR